MAIAVFLVLVTVIAAVWVGYYAGLHKGRFEVNYNAQRANALFSSCNMELNALKVKHASTLMELEDARGATIQSGRN